jgi:DNA polymerase-3 subunit chi
MPAEILFYHLTRRRLEDVLPGLLETCLARGWRAVVQAGSAERCEALDAHLWTYRDDSFLPHGVAPGAFVELQPICLTSKDENPNGAQVKFFIDGAQVVLENLDELDRAVLLFDGQDEAALQNARAQWSLLKRGGFVPTYWQQNEKGGWDKQALN